MVKLTELPYYRDTSRLFSQVADEPWSIFLDSAYPHINLGRYDIIAARPYATLKTFHNETEISHPDGRIEVACDDPFSLVKKFLGKIESHSPVIPFAGGALGYFAYDLGRRIEHLPSVAVNDMTMPDMAIGLYDWALVTDHQQRRSWLAGGGRVSRTLEDWQALQDLLQPASALNKPTFLVSSPTKTNMDREYYACAFNRIKRYIRVGDCYQVNLAQRFSTAVSGHPWFAYMRLRKLNPAPYSGYMNLPEGAILSTSPERFLKVDKGMVETKPIKGTRRRYRNIEQDRAAREDLLESEKDRAENLMIVDLLRNDIGKSCLPGSVSVPSLFALESFAHVHHMVSTINGQLADHQHALDLLRACFPGGSVTGAPKVRAMEIIEELEPHRRSIYCGAMAYIGYNGNMDSNITIRTLVHHQNQIYCWAGGGIVADSKLDAEYRECFDKVSALLNFFSVESNLDH